MGITTGLSPTDGPFASAMVNSLKTFTGSAATALIEGLGTAHEHFHSNMLVDHLGNRALATGQSIDAVHGLGELAHRIHELAWRDSTSCSYGAQIWMGANAKVSGVCAMSGAQIKRGDRIFHPRHSKPAPVNAGAMILASAIDAANPV